MRGPQPWRTNRSRVLRSQPISAEAKLWSRLRNRHLAGLKFVRQAPVEPYFVDFLCREHMVVVEVDGGTHRPVAEAPKRRPMHPGRARSRCTRMRHYRRCR